MQKHKKALILYLSSVLKQLSDIFMKPIHNARGFANILYIPRTFNIERTTIFLFSFCMELVTQLNGSALGGLQYHYISKRIHEFLIGNLRFLIHNSLNQLLCYTDIKESAIFMTEIVETLDLNN